MTTTVRRAPARPLRRSTGRRRRRAVLTATVTVAVVAAGAVLALGPGRAVADRVSPATAASDGPVGETPGAAPATGLDPELERRLALAQEAAAADGVTLELRSGWRSAEEQEQVVRDAITKYGSEQEAHRWVLPPESSAHVQGLAVDVGPTEGAYWLEQNGARFGLCRTYDNEVWHFEPVIAPGGTCPPRHPDSSWGW